ncbi:putative gustatory receptor 59e [Drosophila tropicalis]|uniref:putative gustatory receptor 59e n=1 Tax=Drosophila tropicalis TaxID=46794 RepID=UPI0035AB987E
MNNSQGNLRVGLLWIISLCLAVAPSKRGRALHGIWCLLVLGYVWSFNIWKCISFNSDMLTIERVLYLMEYPANMIIVALIIYNVIRSGPSRKYIARQTKLFRVIIGPDQSKSAQQFKARLHRRSLKLLLMTLAFHSLCLLIDMSYFGFDFVKTWSSNSVHNLPAVIISLNLLQFDQALYFLCLLEEQLCQRLEELLLSQRPPMGINKLDARYEMAFSLLVNAGGGSLLLLEQIRSASSRLNRLHGQLIESFGLIVVVNCGNSLISLCEEIFSLFKFFEKPEWDEWLLLIYRCLWSFMHAERIWFILAANERLLEQKCHLSMLLNQLEVCGTRLEQSVNRFLLEIQVGLRQRACGIIDLDTLALGGFISAFMAIVIFLIQIELGNKSLMGFAVNRSHWNYV